MKSVANLNRILLFAVIATITWAGAATGAQLQLSWADNSTNETGFKVERRTGTSGTYAQIASLGSGITSYTDSSLMNSTTYCYRVNAFNSAGSSPYSPEACATTPAAVQTFSLSIAKAGNGVGTVTSSPAGIECGSTCSKTYSSGTTVTLTATPAAGSTFAGWSGTGCGSGTIVVSANMTCTATFNSTPQQFTLMVGIVKAGTSSGTGNGTVTSSPSGINCEPTCSAAYNSGTIVTLTARPATGSMFAGWSGTGCTNGVVTLNSNTSCTATFNPVAPQTYTLSVAKSGTGTGKITSNPAGIDCGSTCLASYNSGTAVTLTATPAAGSSFVGWTGIGCAGGNVTVNANTTCTATFQSTINQLQSRIGVFRPSTGEWLLDYNGNGNWDETGDLYIPPAGESGDFPVVGNWAGTGLSNIGTFTPATGTWRLDTNGDGLLNCAVDTCITDFGQIGDIPVTREMSALNGTVIGTYTPETVVVVNGKNRIRRGQWKFDLDESNSFDGCVIDECDSFGAVGELPVVGDWNDTGDQEIALFLPKYGTWHLDRNGNGKWDGCTNDKCLGRFGTKGDLPVIGDWDATGKVRVGVFRPSTGMWYLDMNANGKLDSCGVDACLGPFGQPGDLPVVGRW